MKTGEGKTLVSTLPAYLNALTEKGVHIVTVNDYLAKRDREWMGQVFEFFGLTVGLEICRTCHRKRREPPIRRILLLGQTMNSDLIICGTIW